MAIREGWHGWDAYAPFYDWENAQTLDRRDVGASQFPWLALARMSSALIGPKK
jgi:hypothetical protein